jgi:tetratricopeptide (TPR) repeat protein
MLGMDGFLRRSLVFLCVFVSLWWTIAAAAEGGATADHLKQARAVLEYYLADNTPDLAFRQGLDPAKADAALALLDKHMALHPADEPVRAWHALAFSALGRHEDAWLEIDAALSAGLAGAAWLNLAGDIQSARGDLSSALDYYSRAALQKKNPWHQWDVARTLSAINDSNATAAWDKLVSDYPQSAAAWLEHGWHAYESGDHARARRDYEQAISIKDSAEAHNRLAIMLAASGDTAGAEAEYRQALALEPSPQLYANLIEQMHLRGAAQAELDSVYSELLAKYPQEPYAQRINGDRLRAAGNPQAALEAYKRAGEDAYTLNAIGNTLFDLKRFDEAAQSYEASLKLAYDPVVLGNLAGALRSSNKTEAERALWEKHVALHGDDGRVREGYANALFAANEFEQALEQYRLAVRYGADSAELHNQAGLALLNLERAGEAADEFKLAAARSPQAVYFGNAGYALGLAGKWVESEAAYRDGLGKFPNDADLTSGLGEALAAQGNSSGAASEVLAAAKEVEAVVEAPVGIGASPSAVGTPVRASATDVETEAVTEAAPAIEIVEPTVEDVELGEESEDEVEGNIDVDGNTADSLTAVPTADALTGVPTLASGPVDASAAVVTPPQPSPEQAKLFAEAAHHAQDAGNIEQAAEAYQRSLDAQPDLNVAADFALLLAKQNRGSQLVELVGSIRSSLGKEHADKLTDRIGRHYLETRDYLGGAAVMQRLIEAEPRAAMPYNQLALIQAAQQDAPAALATVKRGLNDAGDSYIGRYLEASFTATVFGPQAALPLARDVSLLPEAERNGYMLLLKLLDREGNYGEGVEVAQLAFSKNPTNAQIFGHLARNLYFSGDTEGAIAVLEDPANAKLDYPARYEILGQSYLDMGNYVKASGYLNQALALRPESAELLAALGQAQHFMGQTDEARQTLGRALNIEPTLPGALLWQGWVQAAQGASDRAADNFSAVEGNPLSDKEELAWASLGRALLSLQRGNKEAAQVQADKAEAFNVRSEAFFSELDSLRSKL